MIMFVGNFFAWEDYWKIKILKNPKLNLKKCTFWHDFDDITFYLDIVEYSEYLYNYNL